jgi:hypothetical protein
MLFFNSCKKCETGTLELRSGLDGYEFKCLNCAFEMPYTPVEEKKRQPANTAA